MTIETRTTVEFSDVKGIEYRCTHCDSRFFIPMDKFDRVMYECPNCREVMVSDSHFASDKITDADVVRKFVEMVREMKNRNLNIKVQVSVLDRVSGDKD